MNEYLTKGRQTFKMVRYYLGMTQREYAEYLGVNYSTVTGVESGYRKTTDELIGKIVHAFEPTEAFEDYCKRYETMKRLIGEYK